MTSSFSKGQLATILSALDGQRRKPASREAALRAIGRSAEPLGLTAGAILAAAPGLLEGQLNAATWRAALAGTDTSLCPPGADEAQAPARAAAEVQAQPATTSAVAGSIEAPTATAAQERSTARRPPREGTKQAQLIALLRRPGGASLAQIVALTGWQRHTVRGAISGALKKKQGLQVTAEKDAAGERVYRIAGR
jgi:hypothetical protein